MINEAFDDDVPEDDLDQMVAEGTPVEVITEPAVKPGDHVATVAGREVWFNSPKPGQFSAWNRYRDSLIAKFYALKAKASKKPTLEDLAELRDVSEKLDLITIELFESLIVREDDVDFVAMQMIAGKVTVVDLNRILFGGEQAEDDAEPAPKPKKAASKPRAYKKAANASRTRK